MAAVALYSCGVIALGALLIRCGGRRSPRAHELCGSPRWPTAVVRAQRVRPASPVEFSTDEMCWRAPFKVEEGKRYRLRFVVDHPWKDKSIQASPVGFGSERLDWRVRYWAPLLRRSFGDPWFQPLVTVVNGSPTSGVMTSVPMKLLDLDRRIYTGNFRAPASAQSGAIGERRGVPLGWRVQPLLSKQ